jgi:hypothetical protein
MRTGGRLSVDLEDVKLRHSESTSCTPARVYEASWPKDRLLRYTSIADRPPTSRVGVHRGRDTASWKPWSHVIYCGMRLQFQVVTVLRN